ncbi:hypothetical protein B0A56_01440 [Flavobacterium columnare NBRC 100251 = ATCC 23463]|nr:hypothetical protein B0A56_01440 [Flavobacterium columnare NBRC 100251 = ATCC 23463]
MITKGEELLAANLVLPIIKDLVIPKIETIIEKFSPKNFEVDFTAQNIESYLINRYDKFSIIDTLAFPNKQTLFKVLYEPLTIVTEENLKTTKEIKIKNYPANFLPKYVRAIIEDTAGMGKSTIIRKLFLSVIEQKSGIPVLIELRQINNNNDFLKEIQNQLSPLGKPISEDILLKLISEGDFIFLLDGFDEIAKADKKFVIKDLHRFVEKANDNLFLITSRREDSLVSFGDFKKFSVRPLKVNEAHSLIKRYDYYSFQPISNDLITQLEERNSTELADYLKNPFLVSLLYKSFDHKKDIPLKKTQFYRQVYDALFEAHDLSKEGYLKRDKYSNLHLDDFERVLRHIGYFTSIENKVEYEKDYIINIIERVKKHTPDLNFKSSDYLRDLLETVPLFKQDGNFIKWAHKSLQDYFTAKFLWIDAKQNQTTILRKIYDDPQNQRFYNVLDLFYEFDPLLFENTILFWLLKDFKKHINSKPQLKDIDEKLVKIRIASTFHKNSLIAITKKTEYESIISDRPSSSEIVDGYQAKAGKLFKSCPINFNYFESPKVIAFTFINTISSIETILKIINGRIPELANFLSHKVHLKDLPILEEGEIYEVDDDENNILNSDKLYSIANDLLISGYTINYDKAIKKFDDIDTRLKNINTLNEFTNW